MIVTAGFSLMSFSGVSVKRRADFLYEPLLDDRPQQIHELIEGFDEKKLARRQKAALKAAGVTTAA